MSILQTKIDFVALISVKLANPNGDPLGGNSPRTDYNGYGEISDVCIKRKLRNRMQDLGYPVFVQSEDHRVFDDYKSLNDRAKKVGVDPNKDPDGFVKAVCEEWLDVRTFGQVFALKGSEGSSSIGVRGPVSIHQALSFSPVEIEDMQITKCVNLTTEKSGKKDSSTMGMKHFVRFGLYQLKGSINVQTAEKTDFREEDAEVLKECLRTLFVNDASAARPDGSMEVVKLYWWKHNCEIGQYSSAKVHRSVHVLLKENVDQPGSVEDYEITLEELPGLACEVIDGI